MRQKAKLIIVCVVTGLFATASFTSLAMGGSKDPWRSPEGRMVAIRRAQVWMPIDVRSVDIRTGPQGNGAFAPDELVTCDYVKKKMKGASPKFTCRLTPDDEVKVKYGRDNGEVYGEVAASRLLWALGFGSDRMYPVRVACRGCPPDPHASRHDARGQVIFDPAAIERKMDGRTLETFQDSGWGWPELDLVEETVGGAPRAHRDALKLLAVLLQHTDSRPAQQRLLCVAKGAPGEEAGCSATFMMISDVGLTFGAVNQYNRNSIGSVNFEHWSRAPVWKDPRRCVGNLSRSITGTLENPHISEAGRQFLADLLVQLSDSQIHDLFEVARFPERTGSGIVSATVDQWASAFKRKRDEIVNQVCPS